MRAGGGTSFVRGLRVLSTLLGVAALDRRDRRTGLLRCVTALMSDSCENVRLRL